MNRLSGLAVFRQTVPKDDSSVSSEAVVDFTSATETRQTLLFDNFPFVTSAAFANPDAQQPVTIQVEIRDEAGVVLAFDSITLPPLGHTAVATFLRFPATAGKRAPSG